ncbi:MAG: ATP-binding protein, partial [Bacteroidales bacterium]
MGIRAGKIHGPQPHLAAITRYLLACAIVAAATVLRATVDPLIHDQIPYFIYVASVVVATWFCGMDGGVVSTVAAAFAGNYFFVAPRYEFVPHGEDWIAMSLFAAVAFGLVWLVGRWRGAERDLQGFARRLQGQTDELRVLHEEAERVNRAKDEFLATLSHEMRTPLNAILGWARMLDDRRLDESRQQQAAQVILRNAKAQSRLINDLLDVSRIIGGKMQLELSTVDLAEVVAMAVELARPAADAKGIALHAALPSRAPLVGDADRLQQVAWNLVSNAVKFTPKDGRVDVQVEADESRVTLRVVDSGIGIAPEFVPHLFERFRQADSSTTRQHGGLGLGLAVVRHLVELHGGTVNAESAGLGSGASFTVTLPVRAAAAGALRPAPGDRTIDPTRARLREPQLEGVHVLVVDDEEDACEMLATALAEFGART